eukprot:712219-Rhodomonas_salina.1
MHVDALCQGGVVQVGFGVRLIRVCVLQIQESLDARKSEMQALYGPLYPEIKYEKPRSQHNLCQQCSFLYFVSGYTFALPAIPLQSQYLTSPRYDAGMMA